jgi:hypothetical protein
MIAPVIGHPSDIFTQAILSCSLLWLLRAKS